jgi:hypothetical protein
MKAKELANKYGVTPSQVGKIRKEVCTEGEYDPQTREILPSCVQKIDEHYKKQDDSVLDPKFVRVQALSPTPNDNFYYCKLLEKPVRKVRVAIPATHRELMRPNLIFKAQVIEKGGEKFYRHEIIYKREFDRQERIKKIHK